MTNERREALVDEFGKNFRITPHMGVYQWASRVDPRQLARDLIARYQEDVAVTEKNLADMTPEERATRMIEITDHIHGKSGPCPSCMATELERFRDADRKAGAIEALRALRRSYSQANICGARYTPDEIIRRRIADIEADHD